ncbi:Glycosyl transferase family 2 [Lachnospiraceae bacterium KH1T2]|nr:Glycosyl transferase family 2 [Lachnospiraceae bacterium KH1T2]
MKNSNWLISIIVPIWNAEKYIKKTLNSIMFQSYENIEIVLIDDGSDDDTFEICLRYAELDKRIVFISLERNQGVSVARNVGLKNCSGDIVFFVDSDDSIDRSYVENMIRPFLKDSKLEIVIGKSDFGNLDADQISINCNDIVKEGYINCSNAVIQMLEGRYWSWDVWGKAYKREVLKDITFNIDYSNGEDLLFNWEAMSNSQNIYYTSFNGYHYLKRDDSLSHNSDTRNLMSSLSAFCYILQEYEHDFTVENLLIRHFMCRYQKLEKQTDRLLYVSLKNKVKLIIESWVKKYYLKSIKDIILMNFYSDDIYDLIVSISGRKYIYGTGDLAKFFAEKLNRLRIEFECFIVSDSRYINESPDKVHRVLTVESINDNHENVVILKMNAFYWSDVLKHLSYTRCDYLLL